VTCPKCQQAAGFHGYRDRTPLSLLGEVTVWRAYYYCGRCGLGLVPFDDEAGLTSRRLTPAAEQVVSLLGLLDPFEEAAERVLTKLTGLRLSESTIQRTTESAGSRLAELQRQGHTLGDQAPFDWRRDAQGRTCAYVSIDATGVRQQARDGGPAEGRMPYVAVVYNPVPEPPPGADPGAAPATEGLPTPGYEPVPETAAPAQALPGGPAAPGKPAAKGPAPQMQACYLAGLYGLAELGRQLRRQAAQVGMEAAALWIALSDGGNGLEEFLRQNFNRADLVIILDFWHAATYLEALARAWEPKDETARQALAQSWCHTMKHQGGAAILQVLRGLARPQGQAVRAAYQEAVAYIANNQHRMDYPAYLSQGWHIGSGPVESACKTVVGQRLKQAGMRWREYGTDGVCHLRALLKSEPSQWEAFWERKVN
jgi:hypothetical protein